MNSGCFKKCFVAFMLVGCMYMFFGYSIAASDAGLPAGATNAPVERPLDAMEKWFTATIAEIKGKFQDPAITNAAQREILQANLTRYERKLIEHQTFEQTDKAARESRYAESERSRQEILRQSATQNLHTLFQSLDAEHQRISADMDRNAQLWANYSKATEMKDPELIAHTERELIDYLTALIGRIDHKEYPKGMTLSEVMRLYAKHPAQRQVFGWVSKTQLVLLVLTATSLLLPAALLFNWRRRAQKVR